MNSWTKKRARQKRAFSVAKGFICAPARVRAQTKPQRRRKMWRYKVCLKNKIGYTVVARYDSKKDAENAAINFKFLNHGTYFVKRYSEKE